jgi:hypothetical protein
MGKSQLVYHCVTLRPRSKPGVGSTCLKARVRFNMNLDRTLKAVATGFAIVFLLTATADANPPAKPETKREAAAQTAVFDVALSSAKRQDVREAFKKEGAVPEREDDAYWYDIYSAKGLLDGADKLRVGYVAATNQLAILEYEFPSFMDTEQVGRISALVQAKYGAPASKKGRIGLGNVVHTWNQPDGVVITVSRGWPSTTTFLAFTVPAAKKAMDDEVEANKKAAVKQQSKKQSKAF